MKCIILAGGSGERLWPVSRDLYPKSLLNIYGEKSLVGNIYELAKTIVKDKDIIIVTNIRQAADTILQLKQISRNPVIISEPMSKNTAPAVASALTYLKSDKDDIVAIFPVDFSISKAEKFKLSIEKAKREAKKGRIVALGVKPEYAEKGFGYIQIDKKTKGTVKKFIEKPAPEDIKKYIKDTSYYWNTGIYIAQLSVLEEAYNKYAKNITENFSKDMFDENNKIKYEYYEDIPEISIDYAIMEHADNLSLVELNSGWKDYGSWLAIYNNAKKDKNNNHIRGNVIAEDTKDSFIYSSKELIAASGIKNTIVIETEDAVLVCDKSKTSEINKLVKELKKNNDETTQIRKTVFRPWGFYTCLNEGQGWLTKIISVSPGHKLSLQSHEHRSEHWVVLEGTATVILEETVHTLNKRQSIDIPVKSKHSLQNHTKEPLQILEVQKGDYIGEDDIVRYEDMYGRIN